jgi:hypothetical protein
MHTQSKFFASQLIAFIIVFALLSGCDQSPFATNNKAKSASGIEFTIDKSDYNSGEVITYTLHNVGGSTVYLPEPNSRLTMEKRSNQNDWKNLGAWYVTTLQVPEMIPLKSGEKVTFTVEVDLLLKHFEAETPLRFEQGFYPADKFDNQKQFPVHSETFTLHTN